MKNKKDKIIFLSILIVLSICVGIGYSTAYFRANMTYDTNPENNKIVMANVGVTFEDGDTLSLDNALPGDSVSKTFTITNGSDLTALYSIDFSSVTNTFVNDDIVYSLYEVVDDKDDLLVSEIILPSITSNTTSILDCTSIEKNTSKTYKLVLLFKETNTDQSDNMGKEVSATISLNTIDGTKCPVNITELLSTTTNVDGVEITSLDGTVVDETDDKNIRYVGENPNNYIWFNCFDYSDTSTCERWRIIGLMNNLSTEDGTQSLIKIIKADNITDTAGVSQIYWDYSASGSYENVWDNGEGRSTLKSILNDAYYGSKTVTTYKNHTYTFAKDSSDATLPRGITTQTIDKIEKVNWNVTSVEYDETALTYYTTTDTTWEGYIGLMDPADFGFSTDGGNLGRSVCVEYTIEDWNRHSDCYSNTWLPYYNPTDSAQRGSESQSQWTIRPENRAHGGIQVGKGGIVNASPSIIYSEIVRPALYLKSDISILMKENSDGSYENPMIVS